MVAGTAEATNDLRMLSFALKREILLRSPSEVPPPLDTHDFPAEFVESKSHTSRFSIFDRNLYKMTLSMIEPAAVILQHGTLKGSTIVIVRVKITWLNRGSNTGHVLHELHKLQFKALLALRSKTFYSTRPFPRFPCQTMLTADGPVRLHDQVMSLGKQNHSAHTWTMAQMPSPTDDTGQSSPFSIGRKDSCGLSKSHLSSESSGSGISHLLPETSGDESTIWEAALNLPVTVPGDLLPTFCSALA